MAKKKRGRYWTLEFVIAVIIAIIIILSLIFEHFILYFKTQTITLLLFLFIGVKIVDIIKSGGTIFEDYVSLFIIFLLSLLRLITLENQISIAILIATIFMILYSVGLIPTIKKISSSKNVASFVISYFIFIITIIFLFAGTYAINNSYFSHYNSNMNVDFKDALYFSTITFSEVGYGDITPLGINRLIASVEALTGVILNIAFIGYILASKRFKR